MENEGEQATENVAETEAPQETEKKEDFDLFGEPLPKSDDVEDEAVPEETKEETTEEAQPNEDTEKPASEEKIASEENTEEKQDEAKDAEEKPGDDEDAPNTKTNSDKQQDIFSRVFVGHLPTDRCTREEVEELFGKHGAIKGCSVLSGYGFVQYHDPESVEQAIQHLHGYLFHGAHIVVDKTDAARAALGEKPQKRPRSKRGGAPSGGSRGSGGFGGRGDYYGYSGYRDYGPPHYPPRGGYGPPPGHYDYRESYYPPPRRGGGGGYGYNRPRDDYYDRPYYDYRDY